MMLTQQQLFISVKSPDVPNRMSAIFDDDGIVEDMNEDLIDEEFEVTNDV